MPTVLNRALNRLRLLNSYVTGSQNTSVGPPDVLAEVTSHCNLSCPECRRLEFVGKGAHMKWDVFKTILQDGSNHLELAFLFGWGEPLLWPKLFDGIQLARDLGIRTSISTNITMLKGEMARKMAENGPDILTLALDSHVKEVYERYRQGADFDEVYSNLQEFISCSKQSPSKPHVVLQMICSPEASNVAEDYKFFGSQFPQTEIRFRRYKPAEQATSAVTKRRACPVLWRGPAYVRADGQVFPCCILQDQPLGNVVDSNLKTMWNSERMQRLRRMHSNGRIHELKECATCYHSDPQEYSKLSAMAGFLWNSYWIRRLIPLTERVNVMKNRIKTFLQSFQFSPFQKTITQKAYWMKLAAGLMLLVILLSFQVELSDVTAEMLNAVPQWLILASTMHLVGLLISTWRWQLLLAANSVQAPARDLLRSYLTASFLNYFLPARISGDVYRAMDSKKYFGSLLRSSAVVLFEGFTSVYGLMIIAVVATTFYSGWNEIRVLSNFLLVLVTICSIFIFCLYGTRRFKNWLNKPVRFFSKQMPKKFGMKLFAIYEVFLSFSNAQTKISYAFLLGMILQLNLILYFYFISKALGLTISVADFCILMPLIIFVQVLPLTPYGIGVREVTFLYLLSTYFEISQAQALALSFWDHILAFGYSLMGGILYLFRSEQIKVHKAQRKIIL